MRFLDVWQLKELGEIRGASERSGICDGRQRVGEKLNS